jgi:putative DNA primase/helicase
MSDDLLLKSALIYASWGWAIHPLHSITPDGVCSCGERDCSGPGKHPRLSKWPDRATTDPATIRRWWTRWPGANIGLACGLSGLLVVDLDVKRQDNGLETWQALKERYGALDDRHTPASRTPSGGQHILFAANGAALGNSSGKLGPGIDTRGSGGYIVLPPSTLADGQAWSWEPSAHPRDCSPVPLPGCLEELLATANDSPTARSPTAPVHTGAYARAALEGELGKLVMATEGRRNDTLNAAAFSLGQLVGARLLERAEVTSKLQAVAMATGLTERESLATIKSGLDAGEKQPRQVSDRRPMGTSSSQVTKPPAQDPGPVDGEADAEQATELSDDDRYLLSQSADDEGNAQCMARLYGQFFVQCDAWGWMRYTDTHWTRTNAEPALDRAIVDTLKRRRVLAVKAEKEHIVKATKPSSRNVRNCKYLFSSLRAVSVDIFDHDPDLLNVKNGILNLRSGELSPHRAKLFFSYCLPVDYDPNTDYREWQTWLLEVLGGDQDVLAYIQQAVGYSLTGHTWEECLFYLHGPTRAGKGTFTETLLAVLGREPLATEVEFATFTRAREQDPNSADLAKLKPCRLVIASESNKYHSLNAGKVKQLTGGNEVFCALKYRDHFSYRPQYTIWLVSNHPVKGDPDDNALWTRLRVVHFPNSYVGREDKELKAKMRRPEMMSQVLAWAVAGAQKWYRARGKGLQAPAKVAADTQAARADQDYVAQWLAECMTRTDDPNHFMSNATLYESYKEWCRENGIEHPKQMRGLTISLKAQGLEAGVRKKIAGKTRAGCKGLQFAAGTLAD